MAWREKMREPSFRGVPFQVEDSERNAGRCSVTHEFVGREEVFVEDVGPVPKRFSLTGFVFGPDYMEKRDALLAALARPGPGTLVHPFYGELTVSLDGEARCREGKAVGGGRAVFSLNFVLAGSPASPSPRPDLVTVQSRLADEAAQASASAFDEHFGQAASVYERLGQGGLLVNGLFTDLTGLYARAERILDGDILAMIDAVGAYTGLEVSFAYNILKGVKSGQKICDFIRDKASGGSSKSSAAGYSRGRAAAHAVAQVPESAVPENSGNVRRQAAENSQAVERLERESLAVSVCESFVLVKPESAEQATQVFEDVNRVMDSVLAAGASDEVFATFTALKAATVAAVAESSSQARRVREMSTSVTLPSLVLAYRHGGGIANEAELIGRNGVVHPGFVPPGRLEVLDD